MLERSLRRKELAKEIDLDDVLLSPAAVVAWQEMAARIASALQGVRPSDIPDEQARINDNGTLTIYVKIPGKADISLDVPADQWAYQQ